MKKKKKWKENSSYPDCILEGGCAESLLSSAGAEIKVASLIFFKVFNNMNSKLYGDNKCAFRNLDFLHTRGRNYETRLMISHVVP